jgi:Patatin-like phospholipase
MDTSSSTDKDDQCTDQQSSPEPRYLGLSFSGGGYRATAFSLGTMTLLQDLGLMEKVKVLSSVSGGSVAVGFYLCSKAAKGKAFRFQTDFYDPLLEKLNDDGLANSFVQLRHLLGGTKLIKAAANHLHEEIFKDFKDKSTTFGSEAIADLLYRNDTSPDYVFFNTTNITTLGLFRFGLQRNDDEDDKDKKQPIFLLNKYYLKPIADASGYKLYTAAKELRIADCVAASFAFPGGFEPLIFPDDFFNDCSAADGKCFRETLICDRQKSIAFLDGGLYDNLGLASIEDIRCLTLKQIEEEKPEKPVTPILYVIATDADNIQPGVGFYSEPEFPSSDESLIFKKVALNVLSVFKKKPEYGLFFCFLTVLLIVIGAPAAILLLLLILFRKQILREVRKLVVKTPEDLGWMQKLGMSTQTEDNNLPWFAFEAMLALLSNRRQTLLTALNRRLYQLLPAFNGYLKRTRSLTYGYLHQTFKLEKDQEARCYLIRNLIFELNLGADPDPDSALDLITLPVSNYRETSKKEPTAIASKILIADYIADQISRLPEKLSGDLEKCYNDLEVERTAKIWMRLRKNCLRRLSVQVDEIDEEVLIAEPVLRACNDLRKFLETCRPARDKQEQLRKDLFDIAVRAEHEPTWIPLLCEMATNLSTTLWLKGYCCYLFKGSSGKKLKAGWYSYVPVNKSEEQLIINFKESNIDDPAAKVAVVVGYINTCFNIIEFFYSRWAASPSGVNHRLDELIDKTGANTEERSVLEDLKRKLETQTSALSPELYRSLFDRLLCAPPIDQDLLNDWLETWLPNSLESPWARKN